MRFEYATQGGKAAPWCLGCYEAAQSGQLPEATVATNATGQTRSELFELREAVGALTERLKAAETKIAIQHGQIIGLQQRIDTLLPSPEPGKPVALALRERSGERLIIKDDQVVGRIPGSVLPAPAPAVPELLGVDGPI